MQAVDLALQFTIHAKTESRQLRMATSTQMVHLMWIIMDDLGSVLEGTQKPSPASCADGNVPFEVIHNHLAGLLRSAHSSVSKADLMRIQGLIDPAFQQSFANWLIFLQATSYIHPCTAASGMFIINNQWHTQQCT